MLCCPKGYHFINHQRKEKQVPLVIHLINKQMVYYSRCWWRTGEDRKFDTFDMQLILPSTHFPETANINQSYVIYLILTLFLEFQPSGQYMIAFSWIYHNLHVIS